MALTPERKAELLAKYKLTPRAKPTPKLEVVAEAGRLVAPATVRVSPADPNFRNATGGVVRVDLAAAEQQYWQRIAYAEGERARRKALDPYGLGLWGPWED